MEESSHRPRRIRTSAQKSTGPRTPEGKSMAARNSTKHGILSSVILGSSALPGEDLREFERMLGQLGLYFAPIGGMEEILVEQIATALWRKRRVIRFETGCIRSFKDSFKNDPLGALVGGYQDLSTVESRARQASFRLRILESEREDLEREENLLDDRCFDVWKDYYKRLAVAKELSDLKQSGLRTAILALGLSHHQIREEFLKMVGEAVLRTQAELSEINVIIKADTLTEDLRASIPARSEDLDKIIRYETFIDRQVFKAICQLERLQRRRLGERIPPPMILDEQ